MIPNTSSHSLKRSLGTFALIAYGVGDILGAGIYALIGKVAGMVGEAAWISFVVAFVVASLTGLTYAELSARFPRSAGAALFSLAAFKNKSFSYLVGFLVLLSGIVSMATVSQAFAGYLNALFPDLSNPVVIVAFFVTLAAVNFWGIRESSVTNVICTVIEVTGILLVIIAGMKFFGKVDYLNVSPASGTSVHAAILQAGVLAFYAFIGFEDLVNLAEEVHEPEKALPRAILAALGIATVIYFLTALAAVSAVPPAELASSSAPLALVVSKGLPLVPKELFTLIALFAVANTALINFIMSSRILYGMAKERLVPGVFGRVHSKTKTPHIAIVSVFAVVLVLALTGRIVILAQSTSFLLLVVFFLMNLALAVLKFRKCEPKPAFQVPAAVPILGALCCLGLGAYVSLTAFLTVISLILIGFLLYFFQRLIFPFLTH